MARTEIRDLEVEVAKEEQERVVGGATPYGSFGFSTTVETWPDGRVESEAQRIQRCHDAVVLQPAMTIGVGSRFQKGSVLPW